MKMGFMTNILVSNGMESLDEIANWAVLNKFQDLEVGPTIPLDEEIFEKVINEKISISSLTYCRNYLSSDKEEAKTHIEGLKSRIEFASKLGIEKIVTSTGINKTIEEGIYDSADSIRRLPEKSLGEFYEIFAPIVDLAEKRNVKLAFENCPLMGNIAISPYMWRLIFEKIKSDKVGLAYDPSHLIWQFIDPIKPIIEFKDKIFHFHAKDTLIFEDILKDRGIFTDLDWWRYCIPGDGILDWKAFFKTIKDCGFDNTISIEHEDINYEGSIERVHKGLLNGKKFIDQLLLGE
jgi:sugar phosphate isomerase/epimerase